MISHRVYCVCKQLDIAELETSMDEFHVADNTKTFILFVLLALLIIY